MPSPHADTSKNTPLQNLHAQWRGRMTDFAQWRLPLSYPAGTIAEHNAARNSAALFDVSHMAQIVVAGDNAADALAKILPVDLASLAPGKSKYAVMLNQNGGAVDDLIVANDGARGFFIVANAARREADLNHLRQNLPPECRPREIANRALVAVQGPQAEALVAARFPAAQKLRFMECEWLPFKDGEARLSRTGYTGEDGFEISLPAEHAEALCESLAANGAQPAGLGARDTLRIEAALCLYGNELGENISPVEAGLLWTIPKTRREAGGFVGFESVRAHIENGPPRKLVGLRPEGRNIVRAGAKLKGEGGEDIGEVSSGVFSPTLQAPVAMGFVKNPAPAVGESVFAEARGRSVRCEVCKTPFVSHNYKVGG